MAEQLTPAPHAAVPTRSLSSGSQSTLVRSPFIGHTPGSRPNAAGQVGVHLRAGTLPSITLISTWISGLPGLLDACANVFGTHLPQHTGKAVPTEFGLLARTGPEELLLIGDDAQDRCTMLRASIAADVGSVTDLSHARCRIVVTGAQCRTALNKLFALDLREASFPVGDVALTGTHHVPGMLHRLGTDAFDLLVFSTYAHDQLGTLLDAAQEYGVGLELD